MAKNSQTSSGIMTVRSKSLETASGKLPYRLTNDVLFHIISQNSKTSLIHLLTAILGYPEGKIRNVEVLNPIHYNDRIDSKEIILDVLVRMNTGEAADIEIQVEPYPFWTNRALFYAARQIGRQHPGGLYRDLKAVHQISIMDFTLFPEHVRFHEIYRLKSSDSIHTYTDKMDFHVVDLTQISLADEADEQSGLKYWAELFKATSWEEIRSLVKKDARLREVAQMMYGATADENVDYYVRTREDMIDDYNGFIQMMREEAEEARREMEKARKARIESEKARQESNREVKELEKKAEDLKKESESYKKESESYRKESESYRKASEDLKQENKSLTEKTSELEQTNKALNDKLNEQDELIRDLRKQLAMKN